MTTSWSHLMRGELVDSFRVNAGGTMLGVVSLAAAPLSLATAIRGRRFAWMPSGNALIWIAVGIAVVVLLQWGCRLIVHFH
jgi:hypothetical protein